MMIELLTSKYPGMRIWLSQRLTALVMAAYLVLLITTLIITQPSNYEAWQNFVSCWLFKLATLVFFVSLSFHAWVGVRDVFRDYIFNQSLRGFLQIVVDILLVTYVIWLMFILWGL